MWYYYFLDNGGKEVKLSNGETWRRTTSEMHYCCTLEDAVIEANQGEMNEVEESGDAEEEEAVQE